MSMTETEAQNRVYRSFLRGYGEFAAGVGPSAGVAAPVPYASLIQAASLESKELRRSIDACRGALAQLDTLPEAEQAQLKIEARGSLEALQAATEHLLFRLSSLRPADTATAPADAVKPPPARAASARPRKTRPRR